MFSQPAESLAGRLWLSMMETLKAIAATVAPSRCLHAKETGFEAFAKDCKDELSSRVK